MRAAVGAHETAEVLHVEIARDEVGGDELRLAAAVEREGRPVVLGHLTPDDLAESVGAEERYGCDVALAGLGGVVQLAHVRAQRGDEECGGLMATIRDFSSSHPDFETYRGSMAYVGLVLPALMQD